MFENYKNIRPCVLKVLEKGAQDRNEFEKMRFGICSELKRIGIAVPEIKIELLDWNQKNHRKLTPGDAQRQLCDYVDWFFKKDCKISCRGLKDYCSFPNGGCLFSKPQHTGIIPLPFALVDAMVFLEKECRPHGNLMGLLIKTLRKIQNDKNAPVIIFAGVREIRSRLNHEERVDLDAMTILRALNKLEEVGMLKITHGKSGTFGRRTANGYSFLPWQQPNPHYP